MHAIGPRLMISICRSRGELPSSRPEVAPLVGHDLGHAVRPDAEPARVVPGEVLDTVAEAVVAAALAVARLLAHLVVDRLVVLARVERQPVRVVRVREHAVERAVRARAREPLRAVEDDLHGDVDLGPLVVPVRRARDLDAVGDHRARRVRPARRAVLRDVLVQVLRQHAAAVEVVPRERARQRALLHGADSGSLQLMNGPCVGVGACESVGPSWAAPSRPPSAGSSAAATAAPSARPSPRRPRRGRRRARPRRPRRGALAPLAAVGATVGCGTGNGAPRASSPSSPPSSPPPPLPLPLPRCHHSSLCARSRRWRRASSSSECCSSSAIGVVAVRARRRGVAQAERVARGRELGLALVRERADLLLHARLGELPRRRASSPPHSMSAMVNWPRPVPGFAGSAPRAARLPVRPIMSAGVGPPRASRAPRRARRPHRGEHLVTCDKVTCPIVHEFWPATDMSHSMLEQSRPHEKNDAPYRAPPSPPIGWGKPSIKPGEIPPTAVAAYPPQYCREVHFAHFKDVYTGGAAFPRAAVPPARRRAPATRHTAAAAAAAAPRRHAGLRAFAATGRRGAGCATRARQADDLDALPIDARDVAVAASPRPSRARPSAGPRATAPRAWRGPRGARPPRAAACAPTRSPRAAHVALEEIGAQAASSGRSARARRRSPCS